MTDRAVGTDPLEEERDLLFRSLDDLDREWEAGELDRADYEALRDGYTARMAALLREPDTDRTDRDEPSPDESGAGSGGGSGPWRSLATVAVVLIVAGLAGLVLARTAGERGVGDQLTGEIDASPRSRVIRCQELGATGGDLLGALQCFDEVLVDDPENAEALAYRGWYLLLASGSLQDGEELAPDDQALADELVASGMAYLDRAIEVDPDFPDPLAFRATVNDRLGRSDDVCADIGTLRSLDPPPFFLDQTDPIAARNGC